MAIVRIDLQSGLEGLDRRVRLLTDQNLRYMAAKALTGASQAAQAALKDATPRFITNPTRWTLGGTYVRFARAQDLTTEVGFRQDPQGRGNAAGRYLQPIVKGTTPKLKAADLAATKLAKQPSGAVLVPAKSARLTNAAGNVPLSRYATILGGARQAKGNYFVAPLRKGSTTLGVFERKEGFIGRTSTIERSRRLLFVLDRNPKARRPQFPVPTVLRQAFEQAWPGQLKAAYQAEVARRLGGR